LERTGVMESVGAELKSQREQKRISLSEIAQTTRINIHYLQALEDGNYSALPGGMYNRAFLKVYCEHLNLDPVEYLARYDRETYSPMDKVARAKAHVPQQSGNGLTVHPLAAWAVMFLVSVIGLYFSRSWISAVFSPYFAKSPAITLPRTEQVSPPAAAPATALATAPSEPKQDVQNERIQPNPNAADTSVAGTRRDDSAAMQALPDQEQESNSAAPKMRLEFLAVEKCWVSINSDGNRMQRLFSPGESQAFSAADRFYIIVGNAGGIRLKINGKPAKPLGKSGEVIRLLINEQNIEELIEKASG
jgi:cytoskeleton protein RodZ